jgi:hypothetical protein
MSTPQTAHSVSVTRDSLAGLGINHPPQSGEAWAPGCTTAAAPVATVGESEPGIVTPATGASFLPVAGQISDKLRDKFPGNGAGYHPPRGNPPPAPLPDNAQGHRLGGVQGRKGRVR